MNPEHIGSSRRGLREWLVQRLTALYMAGFVVYAIVYFSFRPPLSFEQWHGWFAAGPVRAAVGLFCLSVLVHGWIGVRSVFLDYLKPLWVRFTASVAVAVAFIGLGLWLIELLVGAGGWR